MSRKVDENGWLTYTPQNESIEYAPVRHGQWISEDTIFGGVPFYCSECGFGKYVRDERSYAYCPNCGAYMMEDYKNE